MERQKGTEQLPEVIYIDDILHTLYTTPLLPWLRDEGASWVFDLRTPQCKRGYIGRWEIRGDTLWLIDVYAWRDGMHTGLPDLFDGKKEVVAEWFSGPLIVEPAASEIPDGAYPEVRTLLVEGGRLVEG